MTSIGIPNPSTPGNGGIHPAAQTAGSPGAATRPPAAAAPNPKQQAVTFALELAKIRATLPGASANRGTDVKQLIADATEIAAFIGQPAAPRTFG